MNFAIVAKSALVSWESFALFSRDNCSLQIITLKCEFRYCCKICPCFSDEQLHFAAYFLATSVNISIDFHQSFYIMKLINFNLIYQPFLWFVVWSFYFVTLLPKKKKNWLLKVIKRCLEIVHFKLIIRHAFFLFSKSKKGFLGFSESTLSPWIGSKVSKRNLLISRLRGDLILQRNLVS